MAEAPTPVPRRLQPHEWPALAAFVHVHNRDGAGRIRCLHSEQGETVDQHARELAGLPPDRAVFFVLDAPDGGTLAWAGCHFDPELGRGWLRGPLLASQARADDADRLLRAVESAVPRLRWLDALPTEGDAALQALYGRAGYRLLNVHRIMQVTVDEATPPGAVAASDTVRSAMRDDLSRLLPLHHRLFAHSYLKDDEIAAALDDPARFVAVVDGGYVIAKDEPDLDEVYVDYLGVDEAARGRGRGERLLRAAMAWGRDRGRRHTTLAVREDRLAAMSLYLRCGFVQISAGAQWRKERDDDSSAG